jgi:anhydro-N-acetylmuramic acid kinase
MSGTSLDGLDVAAVVFSGQGPTVRLVRVIAAATLPLDPGVRRSLAALLGKCPDALSDVRGILAAVNDCNTAWAAAAADAVWAWLCCVGLPLGSVDAIGCHGQTIWHRDPAAAPSATVGAAMPAGMGATLQIGDGEVFLQRLWSNAHATAAAQHTALPLMVWNFRAADVGAGGAGAPLVPYFDRRIVAAETARQEAATSNGSTAPTHIVPLNLGGIANFTLIRMGRAAGAASSAEGPEGTDSAILDARDAGPANVVADEAIRACLFGVASDTDGGTERRRAATDAGLRWGADAGAAGSVDCCDWDGSWSSRGRSLVAASPDWAHRASELDFALRSHPFAVAAGARRSTGREDFGATFVAGAWADFTARERACGDAASLVDATAVFVASALEFSAWCIGQSLHRAFFSTTAAAGEGGEASLVVLASGGGARNPSLLTAIASALTAMGSFNACTVRQLGDVVRIPGLEAPGAFEDAKEAMAFALLAHERIHREPTNEPAATGAKRRVLLGQVSEALPL